MRVGALIALVAGAAVGTTSGCGGRAPAAKPAATAEPAPVDAAAPIDREMLGQIAAGLEDVLSTMAAITESAADCPAMAAQLGQLFEHSAPLFEMARAQGADPEAGPVLTAMVDARAAAVQPLVERISRGLQRCQLDPAVAAVMERMPTL